MYARLRRLSIGAWLGLGAWGLGSWGLGLGAWAWGLENDDADFSTSRACEFAIFSITATACRRRLGISLVFAPHDLLASPMLLDAIWLEIIANSMRSQSPTNSRSPCMRRQPTFRPVSDMGCKASCRRAAVSLRRTSSKGAARDSQGDYLRFLDIAVGSAREALY